MDVQEVLNNINRIVKSYEKNLELEENFIKDSSCKLANELYDIFDSYGLNKQHYGDLLYEVNKILKSSMKEVIDGVCEYRNQNSVLLRSQEEIIKEIRLQNNKYEQVFSQIDQIKDIQHQKNDKRYMKYGQEIATMLNYQFTELSNEVLSLISNNSIDSNEVKVLRSKILNLILPNFNMSYAQLFDKH